MKKIKIFIAKIICSDFTGEIIAKLCKNIIPFYGLKIITKSNQINPSSKAKLFWGIYESAEIRFIQKYLTVNDNVIELGASLGVVSCIIGSIIGEEGKCISVEANPNLIPIILDNLNNNNINNIQINNVAIDYNNNINGYSIFNISDDHLSSSISNLNINSISVKVISSKLNTLVDLINIKKTTLISDIEGAEIGFILNEKNLSIHFKNVIIELHDAVFEGKKYLVKDMVDILTKKHKLKLIESCGNVFVFES